MTAVILAGGRSSRFGSNKALVRLNGQHLIEVIADLLKNIFEETLVFTKNKRQYAFLESRRLHVVNDTSPAVHPLVGLRSALAYARTDKIFVCACDMPFLEPRIIGALCHEAREYDAVVPIWKKNMQPFCGVYSKKCLAPIDALLKSPHKGLRHLLDQVHSLILAEETLTLRDVSAHPFFDVDTKEQYQEALKIMETTQC